MGCNSQNMQIINKVGKNLSHIICYKYDNSRHFSQKYIELKSALQRNSCGLYLLCFNKKDRKKIIFLRPKFGQLEQIGLLNNTKDCWIAGTMVKSFIAGTIN